MNKPIEVKPTTQYVRSYRKLQMKHDNNVLDRLDDILEFLMNAQPLPLKYRPHKLSGVKNTWECHVTGDVLLTWRYIDNELILELHLLNLTNHDKLSRKSKIHGNHLLVYV